MRLQIGFVSQLATALGILIVSSTAANAANRAPTITGNPASSLKVGATYSFVPAAKDADGNRLIFSIAGKPAWATFKTSSGALTGKPSAKQAGTYKKIVISVTDGKIRRSLSAFDINVTAANSAPKISGKPSTQATVGTAFTFKPSASDADGDRLAYSIRNKPNWMTFSTVTGAITGNPRSADIGKYSGIGISVSDGKTSAVLPSFDIAVSSTQQADQASQGSGAVTVEWLPPTENTDGTALRDLAGYRLQYGKSASALDHVVQISNPSISRLVVDNLSAGTHYFALKAYSKSGIESAMSEVVGKKVQ